MNKKKIGIITLNGYFNFGNRLQNFALTKVLEKKGFDVYTLWNIDKKDVIKNYIKSKIPFIKKYKRLRKFYLFSKKNMKEKNISKKDDMDYYVVGSDQVWNYKLMDKDRTWFYAPQDKVTISYAASLGPSEMPDDFGKKLAKMLSNYDAISVREEKGKKLIENIVDNKKICKHIDPTLLLSTVDWESIIKKTYKKIPNNYIFVYFLGNINKNYYDEIQNYATQKNAKIINILDEKCDFFDVGPEEFLYLIKNSLLVCTDSFHACVFSFKFDKPFLIFKRTGEGISNDLYSRIENLLELFKIKNCEYKGGKITDEFLKIDYSEGKKVLKKEIKKSDKYLSKYLK